MTNIELSSDVVLIARFILFIFVLIFISGVCLIIKPLKKVIKRGRKASRRQKAWKKNKLTRKQNSHTIGNGNN
jgi:TRAP-type mannitol/chloroaromatic compound transport system permease small subunit